MTPTVCFQSLPTELRLEIYDFLFTDKDEQHYPHPLLEVTTQVKNECVSVLFPKLQMYIDGHEDKNDAWWFITFRAQRTEPPRQWREDKSHRYTWEAIRDDPEIATLLPRLGSLYFGEDTCWTAPDVSTTVRFNRHIALRMSTDFRTLIDGSAFCNINILGKLMYYIRGETLEYGHFRRSHEGTEEEVEKQLWPDGRVQVELTCRLANGEEVDLIPPAKGENVVKWLEPYPEWLQKVQNEELGQALDSNR
ncbi:hypothetical protein D6C87_03893 [Aureobasidium pullulans]|uniref:F-box domain-containing protein n=1 Tax=Aureobasidium pullulans TaxID=5580 RepID=A0AB38LYR2_AURPU|nr:hypothetical protein D6C94_04743 [Aureobasidium pullulans]THZ44035.1 hypothetical protein D6C87_03893 [Aureobasidium pullulans]